MIAGPASVHSQCTGPRIARFCFLQSCWEEMKSLRKFLKRKKKVELLRPFLSFFFVFFSIWLLLISLIIVVCFLLLKFWLALLLLNIKSSLLFSLLLCQSLVDPLWLKYWSLLNFKFKFWGNCLLFLCCVVHLFDGLQVIHFCTWALTTTCTSSLLGIPARRTLRGLAKLLAVVSGWAATRTCTSRSGIGSSGTRSNSPLWCWKQMYELLQGYLN